MGRGLSQKCAFGLPPHPSPKEVKGEKKPMIVTIVARKE